ncbi:arylamine N-acetyltransferase family protein [Glycomyces arizonensis]|uniref:arylamine N-acetyltransferase family protein n=1 Tax=Glycomyces arizonensis TaxID=256035 RepID=UPI0004164FAD|nr:arylamine N-acetyltransferase [Glycomyces arizonensis]
MFSTSQLDAYLERIGLARPKRLTADALARIHRAHIDTVPYENLEIQLGRPIRLEKGALFEKIVAGRRGGFCYEQNHTLALALEAVGFEVRRVLGGVARAVEGDGNWFNHLPLIVRAGRGEYLVDAGLGVGFRDPLPLREGSHRVGAFNFGLWRIDDDAGLWRCSIDPRVQDLSFDFETSARSVEEFAPKCRELSTSPDSPFVKTLTVQRPGSAATTVLRARTLTVFDPTLPEGKSVHLVEDHGEFAELLGGRFGLALSEEDMEVLWERACEQHERRLAEDAEKAPSAS